ncbi:MAG: M23 family metallopeptidase, partial [bacterium]
MQTIKITSYLLLVVLMAACSRTTRLDRIFEKASPYENYLQRLEKSELDRTALGQDWVKAGQLSLDDSLLIELPYQETGYFSPEAPQALSLRYHVKEGQQIYIRLQPLTQPEARFFLDVFQVNADSSLGKIYHADSLPQLGYEAESNGWHVLRIQPELLRGGAYTLDIGFDPSLDFPVSGRDSRAVQSFFGASRDGGSRSHQGIDIFAPRGTPVLAVADGIVSRKTNSGRGGKVVWLSSPSRGFNLYYAHLDSQTVVPGQRVQPGDTLGFVGNTGNARTTPPHLHFGIYKFG